jgi:hypothetical protein
MIPSMFSSTWPEELAVRRQSRGRALDRDALLARSELPPRRDRPFLYFRDVLRRLPTHPQKLIGELTPRGSAETFDASCPPELAPRAGRPSPRQAK